MNIITKIKNYIVIIWDSIPDDSSEAGKVDKKIIKSIGFKILASFILVIVGVIAAYMAKLDTNNAIVAMVLIPFLKDIIDFLKKMATDYSNK